MPTARCTPGGTRDWLGPHSVQGFAERCTGPAFSLDGGRGGCRWSEV